MTADVHTLSGAYALNALNDLERAAFDRHLAECDTCTQEVAELVATAARLADPTWSAAPPGLRETVLGQVSQTRQVQPGSGRRGAAAARRWHTWATSAAAAVVLVAGSVAGTYLVEESRASDVAAGEQRLAEVAAVLAAPDAQLHRGQAPGGGTLAVAVSQQRGKAVATMTGMPEPLAGRCYQFWRMRDGNPGPAGVLPDGRTDGPQLIDDVRGSQAIAVTQEPCAGSRAPTMDPLAAVTIA